MWGHNGSDMTALFFFGRAGEVRRMSHWPEFAHWLLVNRDDGNGGFVFIQKCFFSRHISLFLVVPSLKQQSQDALVN